MGDKIGILAAGAAKALVLGVRHSHSAPLTAQRVVLSAFLGNVRLKAVVAPSAEHMRLRAAVRLATEEDVRLRWLAPDGVFCLGRLVIADAATIIGPTAATRVLVLVRDEGSVARMVAHRHTGVTIVRADTGGTHVSTARARARGALAV